MTPNPATGTERDRSHRSFVESPSRGSDGTAQEVYVGNGDNAPVPTYQFYGTPTVLSGNGVTQPDNDAELISEVVTVDKLRIININVSCFVEGKTSFLVNGQVIATSRTAPSKPDAVIPFIPYYEALLGDVIEVKFKARPNSPIGEVESYINAAIL